MRSIPNEDRQTTHINMRIGVHYYEWESGMTSNYYDRASFSKGSPSSLRNDPINRRCADGKGKVTDTVSSGLIEKQPNSALRTHRPIC